MSRSKSTTSITPQHKHVFEFIDPSVAARDANLAAVISFRRAQSKSGEMILPRDPASFDDSEHSTVSVRHGLERNGSVVSRQDSTVAGPSRQQSIRFTRPSTRPSRAQPSRTNDGQGTPATYTQGEGAATISRPSSTMSCNKKTNAYTLTRRYLDSMHSPEDCYPPEHDAISVNSSFRGLRKSRSMFSSDRIGTGYSFNSGFSEASHVAPDRQKAPSASGIGLRASTSMRFSKSRGAAVSRSTSNAGNDLAVRMAREKFHELSQSQAQLPSQSSMFFRSKNKRSEAPGLRKSLRNSSNSTMLSSTFSTNNFAASKQPSLRATARKVSHGLRSKLRGLFTQSKASSKTSEAEQNVSMHDSDESCLHVDGQLAEEGSICRVASRIPSLHDVPSNQQLRSRKGSVESMNSAECHSPDDKSRVTSWTNSFVASTSDWELQRLSVIKENGTHVPSSSFQASQINSFGQAKTVDSQRVYSALMKRMDEAGEAAEGPTIQHEPGVIPESTSSNLQNGLPSWASSTIRVVHHGDVFRDDDAHYQSSSNDDDEDPHRSKSARTVAHCPIPLYTVNQPEIPLSRPASLRSEYGPPRAISQRSSAFFASPTCHTFKTPSPYRRALQENAKSWEPTQANESMFHQSLSALVLPTRHTSSVISDPDARMDYEESIYSNVTEDERHGSRSKVVQGAGTDHYDIETLDQPAMESDHKRDVSSASSVEWKTWLSANVSKIETPRTPTMMDRTGMPMLGHVREYAEIDSFGEPLNPENGTSASCSPSKQVKGSTQRMPDAYSSWSSSRKVLLRSDENEAPTTYKFSKHEPPVIPPRNTLRTIPSLPAIGDGFSKPVAEVQRMRSLNTIGRLNSTPEEARLKRRSRARPSGWKGSPTKSSPAANSPARLSVYSNSGLEDGRRESQDIGISGPDVDVRTLGSKGMVDVFLSSRRRTKCNVDGLGSSPAFL